MRINPSRAYSPHSSRVQKKKVKLFKRHMRVVNALAVAPATPAQLADKFNWSAAEVREIIKPLLQGGILMVSHIRHEGIYFTQA